MRCTTLVRLAIPLLLLIGHYAGTASGQEVVTNGAAHLPRDPTDGVTSGPSWITPERFPVPSGWRSIRDIGSLVYGPPVIVSQRAQMELAFLEATWKTLDPVGITNRWMNHTIHPAQTPGLENYTAVVEHNIEYVESQQQVNFINAQIIKAGTQQTLSIVNRMVTANIIIQYMLTTNSLGSNADSLPLNVTTMDIADTKSRIQLQGFNLVPFTFDKQVLLMETLLHLWTTATPPVPVSLLNVSDWQAAAAAASDPPRGADGIETIELDIWTTLNPPWGWSTEEVWDVVAVPDARVWSRTARLGVPFNVSLVGATTYLRRKGELLAEVATYGTAAAAEELTGGSFMDRMRQQMSAVAGVTVLAAVLAAITWAALFSPRRAGYAKQQLDAQSSGGSLRHAAWNSVRGSVRGSSKGGFYSSVANSTSTLMTEFSGGTVNSGSTEMSARRLDDLDTSEMDLSQLRVCKRPNGDDWVLGQGTFGTVYKAQRHGTSEVAVKFVPCLVADDQKLHQLRREIAIAKRISYDKHIVQFYGACTTVNGAWLCMEYMEGGDLRDALGKDYRYGTHVFDWHNKGQDVALAIAQGLHFLHHSNVIHRDVKTSNILLTAEGTAKVADVGLATMADHFSSARTAGTFLYAAPEILMGQPSTEKVDSFSYGVVLWEIVTKERSQRGNWRPVRVPEECPAEVEALLQDCITDDVERRPSMKQIVRRLRAARKDLPALPDPDEATGTVAGL